MKITGLFHIHSNYSYDGELSLKEIVLLAEKYNCKFVVLNEHINKLTQEKYKELLSYCQQLSNENFCLMPGIEFTCCNNKVHILALGIKDIIFEDNTKKILDFIKAQNGLAILAHPYRKEALNLIKEFMSKFEGIEVWNVREDGKGIPKYKNIKLLKELRSKGYSLLSFGGLDFHNLEDFGLVKTAIEVNSITQNNLLKAFREGNFYIKKGIFVIDSQGSIKYLGKYFYRFCRFFYASFKNFAKFIEKILKVLRIEPPAFIYKIVRKLF
ncbi:MAG: PHP domain-containing protein [bacterium]|nr:PHP domain-containing protein [bacterium]